MSAWTELWDNHSCAEEICPTCQGKVRQLVEERNQWLYREAETERLREENERLKDRLALTAVEELEQENERLKDEVWKLTDESSDALREAETLQARLSVVEDKASFWHKKADEWAEHMKAAEQELDLWRRGQLSDKDRHYEEGKK